MSESQKNPTVERKVSGYTIEYWDDFLDEWRRIPNKDFPTEAEAEKYLASISQDMSLLECQRLAIKYKIKPFQFYG